ncbi:MAG: AAA family ATPase [Lysobacterales bacterium]
MIRPLADIEAEIAEQHELAASIKAARAAACPRVELIRGSDLQPEPIAWLWPGWIARGKLHVFGGAPGTGKTTIAMALAAVITNGGCWPDGTRSAIGNVLIWSGEDDPADTLIPRLILAGADLQRVHFIAAVTDAGERRPFDPARDTEPLARRLGEIGGVRMLIVDPIVSAIAGDSHRNAEVRRGLQPLVDLAAAANCALLGITHFSKGTGGRDPVERLTGSLAFGALARIVLVAAKHQSDTDPGRTDRLFCRAKSNIGPDDGGFSYAMLQAPLKSHPCIVAAMIEWGAPVAGAARELLATADEPGTDGGAQSDARQFLSDLLADGPMPASDVFKTGEAAGYAKRTIQRAGSAIPVARTKQGMHGGWVWSLPKVPEDSRTKYLGAFAPSTTKEDAKKNTLNTEGAKKNCSAPSGIYELLTHGQAHIAASAQPPSQPTEPDLVERDGVW